MESEILASMRRFYDAVGRGDLDGLMAELADDFREHEEFPGLTPDRDGVQRMFAAMLAAFPDFKIEVDDLFAAGDKAVARIRMTGTQKGEFMGIPASGRKINVKGMDIVRFADGKAVEHWGVNDALTMMQQLGVVPEPEAA